MAILKGTLEGAKGKVGSIYFKKAGDATVVCELPDNRGARAKTLGQMDCRTRWTNILLTYRYMDGKLIGAFEKKASRVSDYNRFLGVNQDVPIFLTKDQKIRNCCIAAPYQITEGSLPSIEVEDIGNQSLKTNISLGDLIIDENTTIGDLTSAIIRWNHHISNDEKLIFWQVLQKEYECPNIETRVSVIILDSTSRIRVWDAAQVGFESVDGFLGARNLPLGCFTWVHTYRPSENEPPRVSTQKLIDLNKEMNAYYSSDEAFMAAAKSYGLRPTTMYDHRRNQYQYSPHSKSPLM